ncbi:hypothetical protein RYD26_10615 [Pasteurellaceae bacterium LIM206]|nr:hypothetical protein [Pasteurellaceae bacterium LIM206]
MENKMKEYTLNYPFDGKQWSINIFADTPDQAKEKIKAVAQAKSDGEVKLSIYVPIKPTSRITRVIKRLLEKKKNSTYQS